MVPLRFRKAFARPGDYPSSLRSRSSIRWRRDAGPPTFDLAGRSLAELCSARCARLQVTSADRRRRSSDWNSDRSGPGSGNRSSSREPEDWGQPGPGDDFSRRLSPGARRGGNERYRRSLRPTGPRASENPTGRCSIPRVSDRDTEMSRRTPWTLAQDSCGRPPFGADAKLPGSESVICSDDGAPARSRPGIPTGPGSARDSRTPSDGIRTRAAAHSARSRCPCCP